MSGDPTGSTAFGTWVRSRRAELILTQEDLAVKAGITARTVRNVERDLGAQPRADTRRRLIAALGGERAKPRRPSQLPVPAQLPHEVRAFVGRAAEMSQLDLVLRSGAKGPPAVLVSAVSGTAGIGKTALAVHWAHHVRRSFPDGQLYVDLRGYGPEQPLDPARALAAFLHTLGVPRADLPDDIGELAALYRSSLAGRRVLVVLDNASSADQVRPLLPGAASSFVLITSRDDLVGLVVREGVRRLRVELLPLADAVDLLRVLVGDRVSAEPEAATALAERCSRLPLALRIAAEMAASRPTVPLAALVGELADQDARLDVLEVEKDEHAALRSVFTWSYRWLDQDAARLFRLLGLHPGPEFGLHTAAALLDADLPGTQRQLDALSSGQVIHRVGRERYGMHDLLRAYARELADQQADEENAPAVARIFDYYLSTAAAAIKALVPHEDVGYRPFPTPSWPVPRVERLAAARRWLDAERANLVASAVSATSRGRPPYTVTLADVLMRYLDSGAHHAESSSLQTSALQAAARARRPEG